MSSRNVFLINLQYTIDNGIVLYIDRATQSFRAQLILSWHYLQADDGDDDDDHDDIDVDDVDVDDGVPWRAMMMMMMSVHRGG